MKISVSSYSFSQYIRSGKMTQLDCIKKAKEIGFDAIEFIDITGSNLEEQKQYAAELKKEADACNMEINAYTIGANLYSDSREKMDEEVERLKGQLEVAKILGADIMRHDICYYIYQCAKPISFDLALPTIADNVRKVTEYAKTLGIKTCSENHGHIAQDSDRVERLYNAVNHENYGLLVDIGNFVCVDENPVTAVSRVAPYAIHAHAKDMYIRNTPTEACKSLTRGCRYIGGAAIGEGDVPVKQCIHILKKAGYDGFLSIEYEGVEDCISGIERGFKNLKKILAELEG